MHDQLSHDNSMPGTSFEKVIEPAVRVFSRLMRGYREPAALRLGSRVVQACETEGPSRDTPERPAPKFTIVLRDPGVLLRLALRPDPLRLAEAYLGGALDVEGDLYTALSLKDHFQRLSLNWRDKVAILGDVLRIARAAGKAGNDTGNLVGGNRFKARHTRSSDQEAIAFHYDVSNAFYQLWLDSEQVYSCAYFHTPEESLDQAQRNKLDHICRKLRLQPGDAMLDIGCGWGALVRWAAHNYGVRAHGITLSQRQLDYARQRIAAEGLAHRVTVERRDYRDLPADACYDKIASVGMFEHVGLDHMPLYLASVQRALRPGGLFLNHGITHDEDGRRKTTETEFIHRYVFPDSELDCVSNIQLGMERAGFEIHDVEGLRPHYAMTLRHWVRRLEANRDAAVREVGQTSYRIWRLYMAGCALAFDSGGTGIHQILASKRDGGRWTLPLTRGDLYLDSRSGDVPLRMPL